jgi:ATP-dependent RNA helicase DDX5/DBP2
MGCQSTQKPGVTDVDGKAARKAAKKAAAAVAELEQTEEEQKAARKAAKKAAKLVAAGEVDAAAVEGSEADEKAARKAAKKAAKAAAEEFSADQPDENEKAARKAAKKAARLVAEAADAEATETGEEKAARKALRKAARLAAAEEEEGTPKEGKKRKVAECSGSDTESTTASPVDQKRRKNGDGSSTATKTLGAEAFRKSHQIITDSKCPEPMETFDAAAPALGSALTTALLAQKYVAPTPIQAQAWPIALQGKDMVAVAKTGSGKTCGFLLPALARIAERGPEPRRSGFNRHPATPSVLVLAPTRELVQQIAGEADKFASSVGARVVVMFGGVPKGDQVREAKAGADIVIATPGRLLDLAAGVPEKGISSSITLDKVNYLVLDEADRMLDMGFEPDIRKIVEQCKPSGNPDEGGGATGSRAGTKRQTLFFTATWPKAVQRTARSLTSREAVNVSIGQGADGDKLSANPNVKQTVLMLSPSEKPKKLHEVLKAELGPGQSCLVFAGQKHICDSLESEIKWNRDYGFKPWCRVIHSGRDQWERDEALSQFRSKTAGTGDERAILVATDVAARGLDIPGVALVVVYDFGRSSNNDGTSVESYVHRIGRTGRAGRSGRAWAFFTEEDSGASGLVELLEGAGQEVPSELRELGDAEWYKNMEKENKKAFYRKGGKSKGKGKGSKGGGKGGKSGGKGKGGKSF